MDYTDIKSDVDLIENVKTFGKDPTSPDSGFAKCRFHINIQIPFKLQVINGFERKWPDFVNSKNRHSIQFHSCIFKKTFSATPDNHPALETANFEFVDCVFEDEFNLSDTTFGGKFKFRRCTFKRKVNFFNTTFGNLADFYSCTFKKKTIFLKTDFLGTVVFSASTFKKNVLFTFTLIDKLVIFRGTKFKKGLDLSLSIGEGDINCFRISLKDYKTKLISDPEDKYESTYDEYVTERGFIPIENKRETFRILKQTLVDQDNISESIYFKGLEKETLRKELQSKSSGKRWVILSRKELDRKLEQFNLWLSKYSNDHGNSYGRAIVFMLASSWIFFYFSLLASGKYYPSLCIPDWDFSSGSKLFLLFLYPAHSFDYISSDVSSGWFYLWDYFGRITVGYGIYQFIKAFRKYR